MVYPLFDGYMLLLAEVYDTDRNGKVYEDGITPDVTVVGTGEFRTENDPVVKAAKDLLAQQPACQTMSAPATPAS